jgi:hypothetical protein
MALQQSDNLLAISDNAINIINKSLSSHIKQIQINCKESIEQYIKKEMTLYYGVINGNNPPFSEINISKNDGHSSRYNIKFTSKQLFYSITNNQGITRTIETSEIYDINMPCIKLAIDYITMMVHYTGFSNISNGYYTIIKKMYDGFCEFIKDVSNNPLKYVNVNSDLLNDFRNKYDESKEYELVLNKEHSEILQKKDEISKLKKQLEIEKKELQDYKNIKEEIEKCNKLKKHLIACKLDLKKQRLQYECDLRHFEYEQKLISSINLDDELSKLGECPE